MSTRVRKLEMNVTAEELPEQASPPHALPLLATSVFCDDVRLEANGKVMLIGCYPGNVIISEAAQRVERLWVFTKLMWRTPFDPEGLRLRADFPAQAAVFMSVQVNPMQRDGMAGNAICIWHIRFHPLRPGDLVRVSVEQGRSTLTSGELLAVASTQPTRH